ncbi:MAG: UDP-N-acetylglucosamine 2-epimerase (hydrolyzing) [Elusimicrobia bacterium]|nr:UDP-N-acetylglucosamine 2-epimerase (hydrolyzing) [Elusimicrobiota bacterium]
MTRTIGVVTTGRCDYGIYRPILRRIEQDRDLELRLYVTGMHLAPQFGRTLHFIQEDGFKIHECIKTILSSDSPEGLAKSMGLTTLGFAQAYKRERPDILLIQGDRFDIYGAVLAALPFNIPIAHMHGGESTEGLIDEAIRHSITKMSHLHFVSTPVYARRVIQMGEEPWRVTVSGAPSLDNLKSAKLLNFKELSRKYGVSQDQPFLLATFHPETLTWDKTRFHVQEFLSALEKSGAFVLLTHPNADTGGRLAAEMVKNFAAGAKNAKFFENLGTTDYFSLMSHAGAMVGNSSSGIIEAASFGLPVVNVGERQRGRFHGSNVLNVSCSRAEILGGIQKALSPEFRKKLAGLKNPYGDGRAAEKIVAKLKQVSLDSKLLIKRFYDIGR